MTVQDTTSAVVTTTAAPPATAATLTTVAVVPSEFVCPITMEVMIHPMASRYGHNYERSAIVEWILSSRECPLTRQPLTLRDLVPNHYLAGEIQAWREQNGVLPASSSAAAPTAESRDFMQDFFEQIERQFEGVSIVNKGSHEHEDAEVAPSSSPTNSTGMSGHRVRVWPFAKLRTSARRTRPLVPVATRRETARSNTVMRSR